MTDIEELLEIDDLKIIITHANYDSADKFNELVRNNSLLTFADEAEILEI